LAQPRSFRQLGRAVAQVHRRRTRLTVSSQRFQGSPWGIWGDVVASKDFLRARYCHAFFSFRHSLV